MRLLLCPDSECRLHSGTRDRKINVLGFCKKNVFLHSFYISIFFLSTSATTLSHCAMSVKAGRGTRHKAHGEWQVVFFLFPPSRRLSSLCLQRGSRQLCVEISCCCRLLLPYARGVACRGAHSCPWAVGRWELGGLAWGLSGLNCGSYEHGILIISLD